MKKNRITIFDIQNSMMTTLFFMKSNLKKRINKNFTNEKNSNKKCTF